MSQSPIFYAVIFFIIGFVSGLVVAFLLAELRSPKPSAVEDLSRLPVLPPEPQPAAQESQPMPVPPAARQVAPLSPPAAVSPPLPQDISEPGGVAPVSLNPVMALLHSVPSATLKEKARPTSMAVEVDEILQEKLAFSPLAGRRIRLQEQPDHRLLVLVDDASYDGVSQVSEPEVRQLIQEAVAEWQRRAAQRTS